MADKEEAEKLMYVDPRSLRDPLRRIYLNASRRFGAEIRIRVVPLREPKYVRALIEVHAPKELLRALRHIGISFSRKPIWAKYSWEALADIAQRKVEGIPIGLGEHSEIIRIDVMKPIATSSISATLYLVMDRVLWVDFVGIDMPEGFVELDGFPLPKSETKLHNLALIISEELRKPQHQVLSSIKAYVSGIMRDEEVEMPPLVPEVEELFRWRILTGREETIPKRAYVDFTGLPIHHQRTALRIAATIGTHQLVVSLPSPWRWITKLLRRRYVIVLCPEPQKLGFPTIILEDRIVERVPIGENTVKIERKFKPFWELARKLL